MTMLLGILFLIVLFFVFMAVSRERRNDSCAGCGLRRSLGRGCGRCSDRE
jgi:hypothetical protein